MISRRAIWVVMGLASMSGPLLAESTGSDRQVQVDVVSQPMIDALNDFASQAGIRIVFYTEVTQGVMAPRLAGTYTAEQALQELLKASGLEYTFKDERTVEIHGGNQGKPTADLAQQGGVRLAQTEAENANAADSADREHAEAEGAKLEEIVVTAQKRVERLQDVPLSIAVVSAEDINQRGLFNAEDYLRGIAGVSQVDSAYGQSIVIRGIETSPFFQNFFSSTTTATYFGETPTTTTAGLLSGTNVDLKLVDIQRVEVLRGPQGTAFGSSSLGGAVRTIPVAPQLGRVEAKAAAGYSNTSTHGGDNYHVQVIGNIPLLQDKLAIRAVGYQYQDDGFYRNRAGSDAAFQTRAVTPFGAEAFAIDDEEIGSYYVRGGRIAALWQASDELRFTLSYLSQKNETDGMPVANSGTYEQTMLQVAAEHAHRGQTGGQIDMDVDIVNPVAEYGFGWGELIATYSYTKSHSLQSNPWGAISSDVPVSNQATSDHHERVGEIRLATRLGGAWNFLAGLYIEDIEDDGLADNRWYGSPATSPYGTNPSIGIRHDDRSLKQKAAFGEASWKLLEDLTLTGGVRAYDYTRTFDVDASGALYNGATGIHERRKTEASGNNFRANLSYKLNADALFYTSWSQGFRLGQAQIGLPASTCDLDGNGIVDGTSISIASTRSVNSDDVDSYELGAKFALLDRRINVDAAVFRMEWSGVPVQVRPGFGLCNQGYVANAGESLSDGVELQANFAITDAFRIDLGSSWIHARLNEAVPALNADKGNRLAASPEVNANFGMKYEFRMGRYTAFVRTDAIYVGAIYGDLAESARLKSDDYVKLDAVAGIDIGGLDVNLFMRNLTNENALTYRGTLTRASEFFGYRLRPRTVGLSLSYTF